MSIKTILFGIVASATLTVNQAEALKIRLEPTIAFAQPQYVVQPVPVYYQPQVVHYVPHRHHHHHTKKHHHHRDSIQIHLTLR